MTDYTGGNGKDTIIGSDNEDYVDGGNGGDVLNGGGGDDEIYGQNGSDQLTGGGGDDLLDGNNGIDVAYYSGLIDEYTFTANAGYLHIIHQGGSGPDGHDRVIRVEKLVFTDRVIHLDSGSNAPIARDDHVSITEDAGTYGSGAASVLDNDFDFDGEPLTVSAGTFTGTYGTLTLSSNGTYSYALFAAAQKLAQGEAVQDSFSHSVSDNDGSDPASLIFHITGVNDAPTAHADSAAAGENEAALIDVLANDADVDNGAVLSVTAASAPAGQGSASVVGNQIRFDPGTDFESLAVGESAAVVVGYDIADEHGATSSSTVTVTVAGANDGPAANPDSAAASENGAILVDVLANDTDPDNGAVLTVTTASAPAGQGSASVVGNQVRFDPGTDFDDLAVGESEVVVLGYTISDEHGATSSSTVTVTVTGTNDGPVAHPDSRTTSESSAVVVDVLANDDDADNGAVLTVTAVSGPAGRGTASIVENEVRFDPGDDFDHLASGESETVVLDYTIEDEHGAQASSTATITVQGRDEGTTGTGTNDGETLTGTPGDDTLDALGGDDIVFGLAGNDLIFGGDGNDFLNGEEDDDVVEGGNNEDVLSGGEGNDQLLGQAGSDNLSGEEGDDQLSGGAGFDQLFGDAGDDVLDGGNDDDILAGGGDDDQLTGGSGNDSLDGGDGGDSLSGGDGQDVLTDFAGINSFAGGLGDDHIAAGSADGAQTIDGGDGNDTIRHYYRSSAGTITTGSGRDTVELAHADIGAAAITVTDFTPGADGDIFRLSGDDGSLLSLLSGWDGSSNPFGSGFLRLQQSGADTLLQWDRDGDESGSDWETLVVFENTDAAAFTDANFVPVYHPDGSAPAGQTIIGTAEDDSLAGTVGADTIDALGGNDVVSGLAGADLIAGGDGFDQLDGGADNDSVQGGTDDDFLWGGDGNDSLAGDSGNDAVFGENGNDQLSGGDGNDTVEGGEGDDSLDGGAGLDFLTDFTGTNSFAGGLGDDHIIAASSDGAQTIDGGDGNDTVRHYYRSWASSITTGSGSDTIELAHADVGAAAITVSDFTPGSGGDMFRLSGDDGPLLGLLSGWDGTSNPFDSGFLRLLQDGADTLLQWDRDGAGSDFDWETLVVFANSNAGDFTEANFVPGYHPDGSEPSGQTITGTNDGERLTGTVGADTIDALGGGDTVFGLAGADIIDGGDGFDHLHGGADDDVIEGGNDDDFLHGGDGADQLIGEAGNDALFGENGNDQLSSGDGDDNLEGGDGDDSLDGGAGVDFLTGGPGADVLTGGLDLDIFDLRLLSDAPDEITDFAGGLDKILVSAGSYGGGLVSGGQVSLVSGSAPAATGTSGQFLYDTDDGSLFWDADGTGSGGPVLVATFSSLPSLEASDFIVV